MTVQQRPTDIDPHLREEAPPGGVVATKAVEPPPSEAPPEKAAVELLTVPTWLKVVKRYRKRLRATWRLYRQSKSGLVGLAIMFGFVFVAVFAPFLTPYTTDFVAPAEDVFLADWMRYPLPTNASINLTDPSKLHWQTPEGFNGDEQLESIVAYATEGYAVKLGVDLRAEKSAILINITSNQSRRIPVNTSLMFPVKFRGNLFFAFSEDSLYELTYETFTVKANVSMGFHPTYHSNLWNRWSNTNNLGALFYAMANSSTLAVYSKIPPNTNIGELQEKRFFDKVNLFDYNLTNASEIIGEPIMLHLSLAQNGSMIVVPTSKGIVAFKLDINTTSSGRVRNVTIGEIMWYVTYAEIGERWDREVTPIPNRPISITKEDPSEETGKERIILASSNGWLYAIDRVDGSINWSTTLVTTGLREPRPKGIYPSIIGDLVVTGMSEGRGFITTVDRDTGTITGNGTYYFTLPTAVAGRPDYIPGSNNYFFTSESGTIYILYLTMKLEASFASPGGLLASDAAYMGNIINNKGTSSGNYYALVTEDGEVFTQSITGAYRAPLPPGKYPSGNRYLLGTDVFGGDIWTQLIYATRTELVVGLVAAVLSVVLGTLVGLASGYYGGWLDIVLMRLTDIFLTLPILVVALLLAAVLGPSIGNIILIIAIFSWAGVARVIRAQTLSLKNRAFIDAARVSGASNWSIIMRHLAPNVLPLTFLYMVFTVSGAIITEAILAFLGMGDAQSMTWGMMLQYLRISGNTLRAPWWLLPPGIAITLLSLAFYMVGRAFDEVVNPRLRAR